MKLETMISFLLVTIINGVLCVGCQQQNSEKSIITKIKIVDGIESDVKMNLSSIANDISFIPLETSQYCLLGDIREVLFSEDFILIVDDLPQVLLFRGNGKFLRKIGNKGKGPNEYLDAMQVAFSAKKKEIFLFDGRLNKIMVFDLNTGNCKRVRTINFFPSCMTLLNDSTLAFTCSAALFPYSKINYHLLLVDVNFISTDNFWPKTNQDYVADIKNANVGFMKTYLKNNNLICWDSNIDTIFCFNKKKELIPFFVFDLDKYQIQKKLRYDPIIFKKNVNNSFVIDNFIETDNYFFIEGVLGRKYMRNIFYDKKNGDSKNIVFNYEFCDVGFHNDLDGGIPFWPKGLVSQNILYDQISPFRLKELMKNKYFNRIIISDKQKNKNLKDYLDKAEITDNPILFILTLK